MRNNMPRMLRFILVLLIFASSSQANKAPLSASNREQSISNGAWISSQTRTILESLMMHLIDPNRPCSLTLLGSWTNQDLVTMTTKFTALGNINVVDEKKFGTGSDIMSGCNIVLTHQRFNHNRVCRTKRNTYCIVVDFVKSGEKKFPFTENLPSIGVERRGELDHFHMHFPGCGLSYHNRAILHRPTGRISWSKKENIDLLCETAWVPKEYHTVLKRNSLKYTMLNVGRFVTIPDQRSSFMGIDTLRGEKKYLPTSYLYSPFYIFSDYLGFNFTLMEFLDLQCPKLNSTLYGSYCLAVEDGTNFIHLHTCSFNVNLDLEGREMDFFPLTFDTTRIVCPLPRAKTRLNAILAPFTQTMWICLIVTLAASPFVFVMIHAAYTKLMQKPEVYSGNLLTAVVDSALKNNETSPEQMKDKEAARLWFVLFLLFELTIILVYQCDLRAKMMSIETEDPISTLDDILTKTDRKFFMSRIFKREWSWFNDTWNTLRDQGRFVERTTESLPEIIDQDACGFDTRTNSLYKLQQQQSVDHLMTMKMSDVVTTSAILGWMIKRPGLYKETIVRFLETIKATGIYQKIIFDKTGEPLPSGESDTLRALDLEIFILIYIVLAAGYAASFLVLLIEKAFPPKGVPSKETMNRIKENAGGRFIRSFSVNSSDSGRDIAHAIPVE